MINQKIAIVLALYNGELYLREQINSLLSQTYKNWTLYIRDDGSLDNSVEIVYEYVKLYPEKIVFIEDNKGSLGAVQNFSYLAGQCSEPYIMLCDQDDVWIEHKIQTTYNVIQNMESIYRNMPILVFSDMKIVDEKLNIIASSFWENQKLNPDVSLDLYSILAQNVVTGCTVMINQQLKSIALPIPTDQFLHDHWLSIFGCKYGKVVYIKEPLVLYRQHEKNTLGAHNIGFKYLLTKFFTIIINLENSYKKYQYLPFETDKGKIIYKKIILNIQRLF